MPTSRRRPAHAIRATGAVKVAADQGKCWDTAMREIKLTDDDVVRRDAIGRLMCDFDLPIPEYDRPRRGAREFAGTEADDIYAGFLHRVGLGAPGSLGRRGVRRILGGMGR